ncbi:MAG: MFS transporter [Chloroflexota bacterium]
MDDHKPARSDRLKQQLSAAWEGVKHSAAGLRFERGLPWRIAAGMGVLVLLTALIFAREAHSGLGFWLDLLLALLAGLLGYGLSLLVGLILLRLVRFLLRQTHPLIIVSVAAAVVIQIYYWDDNYWVNYLLAGGVVGTFASLSAAYHLFKDHRAQGSAIWQKIGFAILLTAGVCGVYGIGWLFIAPGFDAATLPGEFQPGPATLQADNPTQPGAYPVSRLTYGSGTDLRRAAYGAEVDILTESVSGASYVNFDGWNEKIREWYWGFGTDALPRNAQVWYPQGEGPFPLVLIVHGNHAMTDFSEDGYAYLAELLASRGFIVASVDQNFLNLSLYGKARYENDARAWLLLQHLEVWEAWNSQPGSIFYNKVDLEQIALVGHSRGGEAVGLAAAFNRLERYPENGRIRWNFNFKIKSVIAIAPVDGQYKPGGHPAELTDVSYLVIQGSHDGDVASFKGIEQYQRVSFTQPDDEYFKAAVYVYRANHAQFNSSWGDQDRRGAVGALLNKAEYLAEDEQRQVAAVYISAFLEATLHGERDYLPLFKDYRSAGDWLPPTSYHTQYQDGGTKLAADFEEDAELTTASLPGSTTRGSSLSIWKERVLRFRNNNLKTSHVVRVGWGFGEASYSVTLPEGVTADWGLGAADALVFLAADEQDPYRAEALVDFSVVLLDRHGDAARVQLSEVVVLSPQFPASFTKIDLWNEEIFENDTELVFQSVRIPLSLFLRDNPHLTLDQLSEIRFVFDQSPNGKISLDEIGFDLETSIP